MTAGGTSSNLLGLTLARSRAAAASGIDVLADGLPDEARSWRILASEGAHFSTARAAGLLGLGRRAVVTVATDDRGAMDLAALGDALAAIADEGSHPIAIVATAGTTDLGAIDPIGAVAERAERVGAWLHVDAAVGGALVLSDTHRHLLDGIERADSVTVDFHKMWFQPFAASALVVADPSVFDLLRVRSAYLDRGDEPDGVTNLVGRSLDTSRRFDAAKVVASLQTVGRTAYGAMVDRVIALAAAAADEVERSESLVLLAKPTTVSCVFTAPGADADRLRAVQQGLFARGEALIGRTQIKGEWALKLTFLNPAASEDATRALVRHVATTITTTP